jgi:hypothetical protein
MPPNASTTPNAERYLLEADALRRRQLNAALLHGSSRTWRDRRRIWPAMLAGVVVVAVIVAVFLVIHALEAEQDRQQQDEQQSSERVSASWVGAGGPAWSRPLQWPT